VITTIQRGGAENAVVSLASEQVKHLENVVVVPLKGEPELYSSLVENGVHVDLSILNKPFIKQVWLFKNKYQTRGIFHAHLPRAEMLLLFSKQTTKYFVTRHNSERFFPKAPKVLSSWLSRIVLRYSYEVVAISEAVKRFLISEYELPEDKLCSVIYYGYRRQTSYTEEKSDGKTIPTKRELNVVSVSRLAPQKNISLMIDFIEKLNANGFPSKLDLVGDGPQRLQIERRIAQSSRCPINLLGRKSGINNLLPKYDLFLLTSHYEGFGMVLLEAMDAGLPILAPLNSAIPEVLGIEHPGLFLSNDINSLYSTFLKIRSNQELIFQMVDSQEKQLRYFDMENYVTKHLKLYQSHLTVQD